MLLDGMSSNYGHEDNNIRKGFFLGDLGVNKCVLTQSYRRYGVYPIDHPGDHFGVTG